VVAGEEPVVSLLLHTEALRVEAGSKLLCDQLGLEVRAGEFWCLIGKNGAGKSSLLHTLAGLLDPSAGAIFYEERDLRTIGMEQLANRRGLLAQQQFDAFSSTALETVLAGRHPYQTGMGWDDEADYEAARDALQAVGMAWAAGKDVMKLSGGERQRVALATLLAQDPQLLLLDEPTSHQDAAAQLAVMGLVQKTLAAGKNRAAIAACHDINLVARYASHVLVMANGRHWMGRIEHVLSPDILQQAFGCTFHFVQTDHGRVFIPR
jgi:iron complex transport system ATP-binding protein